VSNLLLLNTRGIRAASEAPQRIRTDTDALFCNVFSLQNFFGRKYVSIDFAPTVQAPFVTKQISG